MNTKAKELQDSLNFAEQLVRTLRSAIEYEQGAVQNEEVKKETQAIEWKLSEQEKESARLAAQINAMRTEVADLEKRYAKWSTLEALAAREKELRQAVAAGEQELRTISRQRTEAKASLQALLAS
jgi:hypothetical protein